MNPVIRSSPDQPHVRLENLFTTFIILFGLLAIMGFLICLAIAMEVFPERFTEETG